MQRQIGEASVRAQTDDHPVSNTKTACFQAFPEAFVELGPDHRIIGWNPAAAKLFGWSDAESAGRDLLEFLIAPHDQARCAKTLRALAENPTAAEFGQRKEYDASDREGRPIPVEISFFPILCTPSREGSPSLGLFIRDISSRKQLELDADRRLHHLIDQIGEEYYETDLRGTYTFANTRLTEYFGVESCDQIVGRNAADFVPADVLQQAMPAYLRVLANGERVRQEFAVKLNGKLIHVEDTISLKRDANGKPVGFIVLSRDVTERKLAQLELAKAKEAAEGASRAKSEFLANMSHEIRTPMNGIVGMTELVLDSELTAEQRDYLQTVRSSAENLLAIINDILDFSKIEAGRLELERLPFPLCQHLEEIVRTFGPKAHAKGLELVCEVQAGVPESVMGDPTRVRQVITNLLSNSVKFTERGEVSIHVGLAGPEPAPGAESVKLRFSVRDTGIGIPAEKQKLIFEAFSQADGSVTRKYGGTGLGLTIVKRLVEAMSGEIHIESEPGGGSCFQFTLEFGIDRETRRSAVNDRALEDAAVLVVDDNATNRKILMEQLRRWSAKPVEADNARAALIEMQRALDEGRPFGIVLSDVHMPEMDGFELARRIKETRPFAEAVVLMLTSAERAEDMERCRRLGVSSYLIKPVRRADLRAAIIRALQREDSRAAASEPAAVSPAVTTDQPLRILLAEDNIVNQRVASIILQKHGHQVVTVGNGREALAAVDQQSFDVVLMDVQMPELDGFEATRAIREKHAGSGQHLPIIAMTAHALKGDAERCLEAGMDAYISKPIHSGDLLALVAKVGKSPRP